MLVVMTTDLQTLAVSAGRLDLRNAAAMMAAHNMFPIPGDRPNLRGSHDADPEVPASGFCRVDSVLGYAA